MGRPVTPDRLDDAGIDPRERLPTLHRPTCTATRSSTRPTKQAAASSKHLQDHHGPFVSRIGFPIQEAMGIHDGQQGTANVDQAVDGRWSTWQAGRRLR